MKQIEKLKELMTYYNVTRQVGHTRLVKEGTEHYEGPKLILVYNMDHGANTFPKSNKDEIISWQNLKSLRGHHRPLAVDNGTMWGILGDSIEEIEKLQEELAEVRAKIEIIRKVIR